MTPLETATTWPLGHRLVLLLLVVTLFSAISNAQTITLGEAVDNTSLTWTTGGDAGWFGQTSVYYYDGDAAQSGDVASGQSSWIQTTVTGPGLLAFYWRVSQGAQFDLKFYVDGVEKAECYAWDEWELEAYSIPSGDHTLRWVYAPFIHWTGDAGFLDKVVFISGSAIMVESPNGGETWYHRNFYGVRWAGTEDVAKVRIELWKGQKLHYVIAANTDNDGYYKWFVPPTLTPGTDYQIKVISTSNPAVFDYSDSYFSITGWFQSSFGGALVLDGVDDYAEASDDSELDVADGSFTIEAWVNLQSLLREGIISKPGAYSLHIELDYTPNRHDCIGILEPCGVICCTSSRFLSYGWHHIALVYNSETGQAAAYFDGYRRCWRSCSSSNSDQPLRVGKGLWMNDELEGAIDEIRISTIPRYSEAFAPPTSPFTCDEHTLALWHFDEFEGATLFHDACGAVDNLLVGYNGAHTEGVSVRRFYLPFVTKQYD